MAMRYPPIRLALFRCVMFALVLALPPVARTAVLFAAETPQRAKNLIVLIADGCGQAHYDFARWWRGGEPLAIEEHRVGVMKTHIADSVVADSAPAATAFASGILTTDKFIGVGPSAEGMLPGLKAPGDTDMRPYATVLEGAKLAGKSVGIVATSRVTHATPAAYYAHVPDRAREEDIMKMGVYAGIDVMLGGGRGLLLPPERNGHRRDGGDLEAILAARGVRLPRGANDLADIAEGRVWGLFAAGHMETELDRPATAPEQPSLGDMAAKAISLLSTNPACIRTNCFRLCAGRAYPPPAWPPCWASRAEPMMSGGS